MADKHKSHPQAPLYGPSSGSSTGFFTQLSQYEGALSIGWSQLTSVPSTISGYGITDAYTEAEVDALLLGKADVGDSYTKAEADALLADKADSATTLAGYGITDAYTKTATDALFDALTAADIGSGTFGGTGNYTFPAGILIGSATFPGAGSMYKGSTTGTTIIGSAGSGYEFYFTNSVGQGFLGCPVGTLDLSVEGGDLIITAAGKLVKLKAASSARASLNMPHGSAPTSPVNGDMWTTTAGLFIRINGVTKTVTLT
jgi:hypothetical protein